jgi:hypothetical protein
MSPTTTNGQVQLAHKKVGNSATTTIDNSKRKEISEKVGQAVMVFYIGGAGDKESYYGNGPNHNIRDVSDHCDELFSTLKTRKLYFTEYLSYNEVCGESDIQKNVIKIIPDAKMPIYIVGHSLGGWNGAHLSGILNARGYNIEMLITLDPVGSGMGVNTISDLHKSAPKPAAKFWINIRADRKLREMDVSDGVAWAGGQWIVTEGPHLNYVVNLHHAYALTMFATPLKGKAGARDYLYHSIKKIASP